ncbi:major histocompatibility complex class I-related gene protein-like [Pygocentrus nattereri]|uniref:major histocompatibility complex class I-related gene protein-like n=1 Tax=Pygocentrus nattereri TaxID=42514 RepID=UPI001890CF17|nr:major histocompatibility complex class I-related gene protein-like [Pygocentrus nattereri]
MLCIIRAEVDKLKRVHASAHVEHYAGVHTEQRLDCCELLSNNTAGQMRMIDAFNGLSGFEMDYNIHHHSLHTQSKWPIIFDTMMMEYHKTIFPTHDSGGASVTCLITGFYPRHINLTLLRNSQPVSEHLVSGGELLPNGDETYQMRKSLRPGNPDVQECCIFLMCGRNKNNPAPSEGGVWL